jgi:hypothetical protein
MHVFVLAAALTQATPQQPRPPEFHSDVRMIRLDVSVVDGVGRPVAGLRAEDFELREDGSWRRRPAATPRASPRTSRPRSRASATSSAPTTSWATRRRDPTTDASRSVRVKVRPDGLAARTKRGYLAGAPPRF